MEKNLISTIAHSKPTIEKADFDQVNACLRRKLLAKGTIVGDFESELKAYFDIEYCNTADTGTSSLLLSLIAIKNDLKYEVLLPTYVCNSVLHAIKLAGLVPVYYDHNTTWQANVQDINSKITKLTLAIIIVHTMGISFTEFDKIHADGVVIIEDACQAFGSQLKDQKIGTFGDIGIFSFNATKCLTTGEGGAIISSNSKIIDSIRKVRGEYSNTMILSDMNAALGISQLNRYDGFLSRRLDIAKYYISNIQSKSKNRYESIFDLSIHYRFLLYLTNGVNFESIKGDFQVMNISVRKGVDNLLDRSVNYNADLLLSHTISLPIYPSLTESEYKYIAKTTNTILEKYGC